MVTRSSRIRALVGPLALLVAVVAVSGQESESASLARELARLLDEQQLDSIAARDPAAEDQFAAALFVGGSTLLVVSARYALPERLEAHLLEGNYREIYVDLYSASIPESKIFISDMGADGLRPRRSGTNPYDSVELGPRRVAFHGNWRDQGLTEQEYMEAFGEADAAYVRMLTALVEAARGNS